MKKLYIILLGFALAGCNQAANDDANNEFVEDTVVTTNDITGAWESTILTDNNQELKAVAIFTEGYTSNAFYSEDNNIFVGTFGGPWELNNGNIVQQYEYHTMDTTRVGQTSTHVFTLSGDTLKFENGNIWTRIDAGEPGALEGAWLITGRQRDGEITRRTPGTRKTMKILSGERFQWIAYDTDGAKFYGTGGGTYTTGDTTYIENIEFFSRDSSRVGAVLEFTYKLDSGVWHHSGLSSKGDPIYEIWTPRSMLDN